MSGMGVVPLSDEKIIAVTPASTRLAVLQDQKYVSVSAAGAPGPQGPIGPAGGDVFVYDRAGVPATVWPVQHNLNRLVHVTIIGDDGIRRYAVEDQTDPNLLIITFGNPISGKALIG